MKNYNKLKNILILLEAQVDKGLLKEARPQQPQVPGNVNPAELKQLAEEHLKNQEKINKLEKTIARLNDRQEQIAINVASQVSLIKKKQIKVGNILIWLEDVHELIAKGKKTKSYANMYKALIKFIKDEKAIVKAVEKKYHAFVKSNEKANTKVNKDRYDDYTRVNFDRQDEAKKTKGEKLNEDFGAFIKSVGASFAKFLASAAQYLGFQAEQIEKYAKQVKAELAQNS